MKPNKWITYTEYVDIDTGEVLSKKQTKNYITIKTENDYEFKETYENRKRVVYGIRKIRKHCTRNGKQISIW